MLNFSNPIISYFFESSFSFTDSINIQKIKLKENNFYQVESMLNNKKDNIMDISSYPFKKIKNKIKRNVTYDEYGRLFLNGELFFPLNIGTYAAREEDLKLINQSHFNIIHPFFNIERKKMDRIDSLYQGRVKVINPLNFTAFTFPEPNAIAYKEEIYKKDIVDKVNELKDHPALFAWYVNDERFSFYHKDIRNMTLTIHELDPNHPSYSVIMPFGEMPTLLNTTDLFGVDNYPIGGGEIREITDLNGKESEEPLGKPYIPMMQIFDWHISNGTKSGNLTPPTVQEMRNMCWQALALGARGFSFYSLFEINLLDNITPIKDRWKDIVEITDQLWEYKDIILSIDKVNKIKYVQNNNVTFRQWKYNNSNYIAVNNLERRKEIFKIDLLDKYEI